MRKMGVAVTILAAALAAACAKDSARDGSDTAAQRTSAAAAGASRSGSAEAPREAVVYFDYDSAELDRADEEVVRRWATFLSANPGSRVTLAGHCDERGTREYNAALGERRALAVRQQLLASGVTAGQMTVVSYGKEMPVDRGHDEQAWRKNRRVEFSLK